jgi:hypothetical protein
MTTNNQMKPYQGEAFNAAPMNNLSEREKLEFFLTMIGELKIVAENAGLRTLSLQLGVALEGLIDAENRLKAKLRSLC